MLFCTLFFAVVIVRKKTHTQTRSTWSTQCAMGKIWKWKITSYNWKLGGCCVFAVAVELNFPLLQALKQHTVVHDLSQIRILWFISSLAHTVYVLIYESRSRTVAALLLAFLYSTAHFKMIAGKIWLWLGSKQVVTHSVYSSSTHNNKQLAWD